MARLPLYLLSVLGALHVAQAFSACALKRTSSLRFSAKSMVDDLGQRIVTVDGLGEARDKDVLGVSVEHWTARCSDLQVVGLQLNVTGPMGDNELPPVTVVAELLNYTSTTDLPPPTTTAPACKHGYELVPGVGCYKWRPSGNSWQQAQSICESEGALLAVPNTQKEYDALKKFRRNEWVYYPWVGIKKQNGIWKSIEGGDALLIWKQGRPTGAGDCLILRDDGLDNYTCDMNTASFICEQRSL